MKILLVEPDYRHGSIAFRKAAKDPAKKKREDESLWYPPLGLLKLATYHRDKGDEVEFVNGCDKSAVENDLFSHELLWDRIYITTLFTFDWDNVIKTIEFYKKAVGGSTHKIYVGGIMASIMPIDIFEETGIVPVVGVLDSAEKIGFRGDATNIDALPPAYDLLDEKIYAVNDTYYAYTTRGCKRRCKWCGVPEIEPEFQDYIDIKPMINELRERFGDKARLKLMDNNILASDHFEQIVSDLLELGYGRGRTTSTTPPKMRVIDFNQGLDAERFTEERLALLSQLNVRPMRIAFDRLKYRDSYLNALAMAKRYGFREFSNYMLYNEKDTPRDLYERIIININQNREWREEGGKTAAAIYSYPMRFAPIKDNSPAKLNRHRDYVPPEPARDIDYLQEAQWTKRFTRSIEIIKGASHGAVSPTPSLALRAFGETYEEFIANLYMPEELLRNRNRYEARIYPCDPDRMPGTGEVEEFREFILRLLTSREDAFFEFHQAVSPCTKEAVKEALKTCQSNEVREWLQWYLKPT